MYTHLLAPVDGSKLSGGTLKTAIDLAQSLGAQLTVRYALPTAFTYGYATICGES
jgi:nucleotide-binding universal stress UspA family protein